jgi:hypothetical protein
LDEGFRGRHEITDAQRLVMGTEDPESIAYDEDEDGDDDDFDPDD